MVVGLELTGLKSTKSFFSGTGCAVGGNAGGVWHEEMVAINTEPAWHDRVIVGMRVGYF